MGDISLVATASYMPENVVDNTFFGENTDASREPLFRGAKLRRHVAEGESAVSMIERATARLVDRTGIDPARDVDIVITNVTCPDMPFTGCGAQVIRQLGCRPDWVLDMHNGGCVSFVFMMDVARSLMATSDAKTALICNVQNSAGRIFALPDNRKLTQSSIPGDGCGVGYLVANAESPVKSIVRRAYGEYADDMQIKAPDGRRYWQPGTTAMSVDFSRRKLGAIVARGNRLVPEVIREACECANLGLDDIDCLITNQPSPIFLRNWREAVLLPPEKHVETFEEHGNLFGAALPISFERGVERGVIHSGANVVLGGFSHAGDYVGAAVVHWRAGEMAA